MLPLSFLILLVFCFSLLSWGFSILLIFPTNQILVLKIFYIFCFVFLALISALILTILFFGTWACVLSHVWLFETPWTVAHQTPLSMNCGLPFPPSGDLLGPGIEPRSPVSPALASRFFTVPPGYFIFNFLFLFLKVESAIIDWDPSFVRIQVIYNINSP